MPYYRDLSQADKDELFDDRCEAFEKNIIDELAFRLELAALDYNATEIEEVVRFYRPPKPEG